MAVQIEVGIIIFSVSGLTVGVCWTVDNERGVEVAVIVPDAVADTVADLEGDIVADTDFDGDPVTDDDPVIDTDADPVAVVDIDARGLIVVLAEGDAENVGFAENVAYPV